MIPKRCAEIAEMLGVDPGAYMDLLDLLYKAHRKVPERPSAHCVCGVGDRAHLACRTFSHIVERAIKAFNLEAELLRAKED